MCSSDLSGMPMQPMMMPGDPAGVPGGYMTPGMAPGNFQGGMPGAGPGGMSGMPMQPGYQGVPGGAGQEYPGGPPVGQGMPAPQDLTIPEPGMEQPQSIPQDAPMPTPDSISTQTRRDQTRVPAGRQSMFAGWRNGLQRNRESRPVSGDGVRPAGWKANR